ncbi:TRAP transporter substrate-binding protein [Sediminimonas sp.]|uniref:TRAP transporter substrate-binding protein n=1 Tax=Sediminimonas sp. TaxID=2823379 RepID=UPI0025DF9EF3|nr:TRAP transporter substrate-binding protein [Sediminimonas sp.]
MTLFKTMLRTAAASAVLAGMSGTAFAQEVTLRMHQFLPAQANVPKLVLEKWAKDVEEDSGDRIDVQHYPSMQLGGKPPELIDQAIDGVADVVWTVAGYSPGRFPQAEVFELPFMMSNAEDTSRAYWEYAEKNMFDSDYKDFKVLGVWVHGPGLIHSAEPVTSLEDMNGKKLRGPTRIITQMLGDLGATPVGMPVPAIPEALSKGVIDGAVIPWEVTAMLKIPEMVHNHTTFGDEALYTTAFIFAMNKDKYEALPDDLKAVIDENSGADFSAFAGKTQAASDQPGYEAAKEMGNNIITLPPEEVARWKEAAQPTIEQWIANMDSKGFDGQAVFDEAKGLIEKHSAE